MRIPEELSESVETIWKDLQGGLGEWAGLLVRGLVGQSEMLREEAGRHLATVREQERRLHRTVAALQRQLEHHPDSQWVGMQLDQARQKLRVVEEQRHKFYFHRQAAHWTQVGDWVTRDLFSMTHPLYSKIGVLQDSKLGLKK